MNNEDTIIDSQYVTESKENEKENIEQSKVESKKSIGLGEKTAYSVGGAVFGAGMTMAGQAMAADSSTENDAEVEEVKSEEVKVEADADAGAVTTAETTAETSTTQSATIADSNPKPEDSPAPEETIVATATGVRVAQVDNNESFAEAFADARAQVGPGGVFEWHGRAYSTYYKEEWDSMSSAERHNYQSSIDYNDVISNESMAQPHNDMAYQGTAHRASYEETSQVEPEPVVNARVEQTAEDVDVQVLEVGQTDLNQDGVPENAAVLKVDGHEVLVVDVDQDGTADMAFCDVDNDGQVDVADLRGENMGMPEMSAGDNYMAQADSAPDYMNDANVGMYEG